MIGGVFEILFFPFRRFSPWVAMIFFSFLTGMFMLFVFKKTSNQKGIREVKNRIKAHLLEIRLFKDNLAVSLKAQANILRCNMKYIGYSFRPMLVMILPLILILIQLQFWFGYAPLDPGRPALLKVELAEGRDPVELPVVLRPSSGLEIETLPVRIRDVGEIDWRFSGTEEGIHTFTLVIGEETIEKKVFVGQKHLTRISPVRTGKGFLQELLYPVEPPIRGSSAVRSVEIQYPPGRMDLFGWKIHWLVVFFVLSIAFGFAFKGVLKVEI